MKRAYCLRFQEGVLWGSSEHRERTNIPQREINWALGQEEKDLKHTLRATLLGQQKLFQHTQKKVNMCEAAFISAGEIWNLWLINKRQKSDDSQEQFSYSSLQWWIFTANILTLILYCMYLVILLKYITTQLLY